MHTEFWHWDQQHQFLHSITHGGASLAQLQTKRRGEIEGNSRLRIPFQVPNMKKTGSNNSYRTISAGYILLLFFHRSCRICWQLTNIPWPAMIKHIGALIFGHKNIAANLRKVTWLMDSDRESWWGDGVDYMYAGVVRSVNVELLLRQLQVDSLRSDVWMWGRCGGFFDRWLGRSDRFHDSPGLESWWRSLLRFFGGVGVSGCPGCWWPAGAVITGCRLAAKVASRLQAIKLFANSWHRTDGGTVYLSSTFHNMFEVMQCDATAAWCRQGVHNQRTMPCGHAAISDHCRRLLTFHFDLELVDFQTTLQNMNWPALTGETFVMFCFWNNGSEHGVYPQLWPFE